MLKINAELFAGRAVAVKLTGKGVSDVEFHNVEITWGELSEATRESLMRDLEAKAKAQGLAPNRRKRS